MKYILLFLTVLLFACTKPTEKTDLSKRTVKICGVLDTLKAGSIRLTGIDVVSGNDLEISQVLNPGTRSFHFEFQLHYAQEVYIRHNDKLLTVFVEPADSIFVRVWNEDSSGSSNSLHFSRVSFSGPNDQMNVQIQEYYKHVKSKSLSRSDLKAMVDLPVDEFLLHFEKQLLVELQILDDHIRENSFDDKLLEWTKSDLTYSLANHLTKHKKNRFDAVIKSVEIDLFPVHDTRFLSSAMFGAYHLHHYNYYKFRRKVASEARDETTKAEVYRRTIERIAQEEPEGVIRDVMIYQQLSKLHRQSYDQFMTVFEPGKQLISNESLINELEVLASRNPSKPEGLSNIMKGLSADEFALIGDIVQRLDTLSDNRILCVDVWATWCAPCIQEIPRYIEIYEDLKSENAELVSLCLASPQSRWGKIVAENDLPGIQIFLDEDQSNIFRSYFDVPAFPTHMLISTGEIAYKTPGPSRALIEEIQSIKKAQKVD